MVMGQRRPQRHNYVFVQLAVGAPVKLADYCFREPIAHQVNFIDINAICRYTSQLLDGKAEIRIEIRIRSTREILFRTRKDLE